MMHPTWPKQEVANTSACIHNSFSLIQSIVHGMSDVLPDITEPKFYFIFFFWYFWLKAITTTASHVPRRFSGRPIINTNMNNSQGDFSRIAFTIYNLGETIIPSGNTDNACVHTWNFSQWRLFCQTIYRSKSLAWADFTYMYPGIFASDLHLYLYIFYLPFPVLCKVFFFLSFFPFLCVCVSAFFWATLDYFAHKRPEKDIQVNVSCLVGGISNNPPYLMPDIKKHLNLFMDQW